MTAGNFKRGASRELTFVVLVIQISPLLVTSLQMRIQSSRCHKVNSRETSPGPTFYISRATQSARFAIYTFDSTGPEHRGDQRDRGSSYRWQGNQAGEWLLLIYRR
ncbi:hypothetical protein BDN72DRAFT_293307 [Pluteus cervinus]|uniref:Uncharacterized protein n=1 Tax=Pluteus cervinus TaxID=181527 RepID=A0ACD3B4Y2_9AGAR|nr:hypothetical protein BDN72DRAFT_293307 [Pluteus cervinus]